MTGQLSLPPAQGPFSDVAALHDTTDREKSEQEYRIILVAFRRLLDCWGDSAANTEILADIIAHRSASLIERVLEGLSLNFEQALELLRNHNDFTSRIEREQRDILVAAIDNLVDFAAAEEYSMMCELPKEIDDSCYEEYEEICRRYNQSWATQENDDVRYASMMAAWWITLSEDTLLTYMTQGDERVRPWHEALEGVSYPKSRFPAELIPPIEYACRCYLVADSIGAVVGSLASPEYTPSVHPVFRESLCKGGRIFSEEHPYFRLSLPPQLRKIVRDIKHKFYVP